MNFSLCPDKTLNSNNFPKGKEAAICNETSVLLRSIVPFHTLQLKTRSCFCSALKIIVKNGANFVCPFVNKGTQYVLPQHSAMFRFQCLVNKNKKNHTHTHKKSLVSKLYEVSSLRVCVRTHKEHAAQNKDMLESVC